MSTVCSIGTPGASWVPGRVTSSPTVHARRNSKKTPPTPPRSLNRASAGHARALAVSRRGALRAAQRPAPLLGALAAATERWPASHPRVRLWLGRRESSGRPSLFAGSPWGRCGGDVGLPGSDRRRLPRRLLRDAAGRGGLASGRRAACSLPAASAVSSAL